jgi:hypothetical protein
VRTTATGGLWPGHLPGAPPPRPPGVPTVPQDHRPGRPGRAGAAPGLRQLRHPQDPSDQDRLLRHPRFHLHFTPTSASWLNLVERFIAELTNRKLRRATHPSVAELEADLAAWIQAWNDDPKPFVWTKTADELLDPLASYLQRTNNSGH